MKEIRLNGLKIDELFDLASNRKNLKSKKSEINQSKIEKI